MTTPAPSPRHFTRHDLATITTGEYNAMSQADRDTYDTALVALWEANYLAQSLADFSADYERIGSRASHEWGA